MEQKTKRPIRKKWLWIGGAALLVLILLIMMLSRPSVSAASMIHSATVSRGDITTTVVGIGTLESGDTRQVQLPADLEIEIYYVKTGDYVEAGDAIAKAGISSLLDGIETLSDELASLDRKINNASDTTKTVYTTTSVSGRVKKVYAEAGDAVADVLARDGALMLISTDGKMAVDITGANTLSAGDSVSVVLADGTEKTGTVKTAASSGFTVTLTDNGPALDEAVTVKDGDGKTLGSGTLYIHRPIGIIGTGGTIKSVSVSENQYVYSGATVAVLKDVPVSGGYEELVAERELVAESLSMLVSAANNNGVLTATFSGTVTSVDGESSSGTSNPASAYGLSAQFSSVNAASALADLMRAAPELPAVTEITSVATLVSVTPVTGRAPVMSIAGQPEYSGTIVWSPQAAVFLPETAYKATVTLTANAGYKFTQNFLPVISGATVTSAAVDQDAEQNTLTMTLEFPKTQAAEQTKPDTDYEMPSGSSGLNGAYSSGNYSSGTDNYSAAVESELLSSICTIASDETIVLTVTIDELDILSVQKGNTAVITFDAIDGTFEGEVTRVSNASSSSGGSAKYKAEILVEKTDDMRVGMNATASINVGSKQDILLLPVDAVQEIGGRVFVYTQGGDDGTALSGEVDIVTGLSDGTMVEVIEGLTEGTTVYYPLVMATDNGMGMNGMDMGGGNMVFGNRGSD